MAINNDQIRSLKNNVTLAGKLAELDPPKFGTTTNGVPYIRLKGAIQFDESSAVCTHSFTSFIKAKKADGSDSPNYTKVVEWVNKAVPMTKDKDNPTMVKLGGSLSANDYVSADGKLHEATQFSVQFFNDFDEYACHLDIEGYIASVADEERGSDDNRVYTGRKRMRLVSRDFYGNVLDIKNIVVPKELSDALEDNGYERGRTALMYISYLPNDGEAKPKSKGFGTQRTEGRSYLETVLTGGNEAYSPDNVKMSISNSTAKMLADERASHLKEIEEKGYQGSSGNSNSGTATNRSGFGSASAPASSYAPVDDDDIPF